MIPQNTGVAALRQFLDDVNAGTKGDKRLYFDGKTLTYDEEAGCWRLFLASFFGAGEAALPNVIRKIAKAKHYNTYFADQSLVARINNFATNRYNPRQCCSEIELVSATKPVATPSKPQSNPGPQPQSNPGPLPADCFDCSEFIAQLETAYQAIKSDAEVPALTEACQNVAILINASADAGYNISQEQADQLLAFKNKVRYAMYPEPKRPPKGIDPLNPPQLVKHGTAADIEQLRQALKALEKETLCCYFKKELEAATIKVATLKERLVELSSGNTFTNKEQQFLAAQIEKWEKQIARGVIPAIPKWYHATPNAPIVGTILDGVIIFAHGRARRGCFVSNEPETDSGYGDYCIALTDRIEVTGLKDRDPSNPKKITLRYPIISQFKATQGFPISYSDTIVPATKLADNQAGVKAWVGFQSGHSTLPVGTTGLGTDGIRIKRNKRIQQGGIKYRQDVSVAHLMHVSHAVDSQKIKEFGANMRYPVYLKTESDLIRKLINHTYGLTLPAAYEHKVDHQPV